jgi:octanoyl-[GcvH]:protein N-octanoyltransferase
MFDLPSALQQSSWYFIDQSRTGLTMNPMASFAMDDTLCEKMAATPDTGFARSWVHDKTVVLGIQDSRLPSIKDGVAYLEEEGYQVIVRNSGGLAVVLDPGIYNLSLIFQEERSLTIDRGYEAMVSFTKELLPELGERITDGEIAPSYCPGRYDLSVDGRKFAGISQRRIRGGIAVQIYLAVQGSGASRAELIRRFYEKAARGGPVKYDYPRIEPERMASLSEITGTPLTNDELTKRILLALRKQSEQLASYHLTEQEEERLAYHLERMQKRNERLQ